jgi:cation:H+ antiporter
MRVLNPADLRNWLLIAVGAAVAAPAIVVRLSGSHVGDAEAVAIFGVAILACAFLLTWTSEAAEVDISRGLALAVIAVIAVLPEYAVDIFFAWTAPANPENAQFATANMTGANRLLVGTAWPAVVLLFWLRTRQTTLKVRGDTSFPLVLLGIATLYSFSIPIKGHISLIDSAVLISIFAVYMLIVSRAPAHEPELVGPAQTIGALPALQRRAVVIAVFLYSAGAVFASAEPFAEGLVDLGRRAGVDEFLLVQWLAPLASEAPEFLVALLLVARGKPVAGMVLLLSSKVSQWTLLVGSLPVAYSISGATLHPLPMDSRQVEEVLLTAAQSALAVAVFASLSISLLEASVLFVMFSSQLFLTDQSVRYGFSFAYIALALLALTRDRYSIPVVFGEARRTVSGLHATDAGADDNPRPRPGKRRR